MKAPLTLIITLVTFVATLASAQAGKRTEYLPKFSLGETSQYVFEVNTPGRHMYPHWLYIDTRDSRSYRPVTWFESAKVKMEILDANSKQVLRTRFIDMRAWRIVDSDELRVPLWGMKESAAFNNSNYLIRVTVMKPSLRQYDKARVQLGLVGG